MTSDLQFPLIRLDPRTVHHRPQGGGLRATQREAFDDLPWEGHRQSDLLWNGLKGSPSIRPPLERLPTGTVWKGHRQSDPNWNGLKGSLSIRPQLERIERVTVNQTPTGTDRKGHCQSDPNWNGLKGFTSIRPQLERFERVTVSQTSTERFERVTVNQTPTGTAWKGQRQSGIHLNCLKGSSSVRPPLGKRPRNGMNRTWAFLSGMISSWYELNFGNISMPFPSWAQATPVLVQGAAHYWSFGAKIPYCFPSVFINERLQESSQKFMLWRSTSRCLQKSVPILFTLQSIQYMQLNAW